MRGVPAEALWAVLPGVLQGGARVKELGVLPGLSKGLGPVIDMRNPSPFRRVCNACGLGKHCASNKRGPRQGCECGTCGGSQEAQP